MKVKFLLISVLLSIAIMGFVFGNFKFSGKKENISSVTSQKQLPPPQANNPWLQKFYIGAVDCEVDYPDYSNLHELGFNLWHKYLSKGLNVSDNKYYPFVDWYGQAGLGHDSTLAPLSAYGSNVTAKIRAISNGGERKLIMTRPKLEYLCYGQRSDYQCEYVSDNENDNPLWFYAFNYPNSASHNVSDSGSTVLRMQYGTDNADTIVKGLRANTEQCRDETGANGIPWQGDSQCEWYIKPRIRIDSSFANDSTNWSKKVCRVNIKNQNGSLIKSFDVKVRNFKINPGTKYYGNYLDEYYFQPYNDTSNQTIYGNWGTDWMYKARGGANDYLAGCNKADIQVYWYGNCDMWLDYVRVDNDVADQLFKGVYDTTWIYNEAHNIGLSTYPAVMKYYLELIEYNNLPCIAYVNSKVKQYSDNTIDIMQDLSNTISAHVPWSRRGTIQNPNFLKNHYIDKAGFTQIFAECYPLIACYRQEPQKFSKIPNTLPKIHEPDSILAEPVSPAEYDTWLQDQLFHRPNILEPGNHISESCTGNPYEGINRHEGYLRFVLKTCDSVSKLANIPFVFLPQIHQNYSQYEVEREPTNEELDMMTNVAVSYGAKGLLYFSYISWETQNRQNYVRGITQNVDNKSLRTTNFYGQTSTTKKQTIQNIVDRVGTKWGSYLLNFDNINRHSYIYNYSDEKTALYNNSCFNQFVTLKYLPQGQQMDCKDGFIPENVPSGWIYECQQNTYLQIATFEDNTSTKYFMVVNRRCSPYINDNSDDNIGGRRKIRAYIKSNYKAFSGSNSWNIIDCETGLVVANFNSLNTGYVELGYFMPGEGKLYKIIAKV